jgi:hypothetical protein
MKTPSQPCVYLWKDVIRVGRYRHPARRFTLRVDRRRLEHWARMFKRMSANGVRVHIPADHSDAAADNRGYVLTLKRVGDRLMALCQFIGADAIRDAARNQVSIGVAPTFVDGHGRVYHDAIVHVALTPVPVVPGQGSFLPAETFSADSTPAGVLTLATAQFQRRANMAQTMLPCSEETLSALHDLVPGLADAPDEQKLDAILQYIQSLSNDNDSANLPSGLSLRVEDSLAPDVRQALLDAVKAKRDLCVSRGALTPAVADVVMARLAPANEVIGLSQRESDATLALSIFTALADNKPVSLGERTGSQARALTRSVPGETQPPGAPLYEKMAAIADGKCVQL